jgi:hypothetical protein
MGAADLYWTSLRLTQTKCVGCRLVLDIPALNTDKIWELPTYVGHP